MGNDSQFIKQDMFVYLNPIHVNNNGHREQHRPYCMGITVEFSFPRILGQCGLSRREMIGVLAFKQYERIEHFEHNPICMN